MRNKLLLLILFYSTAIRGFSQTLGGNTVFNFLTQPATAQLSALGGVNISSIGNDIGMAFHNPSLLRKEMDRQWNTSFNAFFAGISQFAATTGFYLPAQDINLGAGVQYLHYGDILQTDASGNVLGNIRPVDYTVQVMASKQYMERFVIGATAKMINSNYGFYRSSGLAMDVSLLYRDTVSQLQVGIVFKNMGTQLKSYSADIPKEELPFDIQAGISKRLKNAPVQFSLTAHHLQQLNIHYNDTLFNASEGFSDHTTWQKGLAHFVLSSQIYLSDHFEFILGYNFLRRQELNAYGMLSGMNGFSFGTAIHLRKLKVWYATGMYQQNMFHQFSLNFNFAGKVL